MHKLDRLLISASFLIEPIGESTILTEVNDIVTKPVAEAYAKLRQ